MHANSIQRGYALQTLATLFLTQAYTRKRARLYSNSFQQPFRPRLLQNDLVREGWRGSRSKLDKKQAQAFANAEPPLFSQVAIAICSANVLLPRKELFEAWEVASRIDDDFPNASRVADLAAGHGLLGWLLLLLAMQRGQLRTAVCVDKKMPGTAEKLRDIFVQNWPELSQRMHYVEGDLQHVEVDPSILVTSIHACGPLTDLVLQCAVTGGAPVVVMPCCHSLREKKLLLPPEPGLTLDDLIKRAKQDGVVRALDIARVRALEAAGYKVVESMCDSEVTPYNRLLLADVLADESGVKHLSWEAVAPKKRFMSNAGDPIRIVDVVSVAAMAGRKPFLSKRFFCFRALNPEASNLNENIILELASRASSPPPTSNTSSGASVDTDGNNSSKQFWNPAEEVRRALDQKWIRSREEVREKEPVVAVKCIDIYHHPDGRRFCTFEVSFTSTSRELTRNEVKEWRRKIYEALHWWGSNARGGFSIE